MLYLLERCYDGFGVYVGCICQLGDGNRIFVDKHSMDNFIIVNSGDISKIPCRQNFQGIVQEI